MSPEEVIAILQARLTTNQQARADAVLRGDLEAVLRLDADTTSTLETISRLKSSAG